MTLKFSQSLENKTRLHTYLNQMYNYITDKHLPNSNLVLAGILILD